MKEELISVAMPTYNDEKYIAEAIESILNQTYKNFELIIIDDCSKDDNWKIISEYAKKDKRIKAYRNEKNRGISYNLNLAIKKAKGEYIARMDGDDTCTSDRFEIEIKELERTGADLIWTDLTYTDM